MNESMANQAYGTQGPHITNIGIDKSYAGHDRFQNGVLDRNQKVTLYSAGWTEDWASQENASGFFTDKDTIDSCVHNGVLNTNELDGKLQTKLSKFNANSGKIQAHSHVSAYDVDFDKLDSLKTDDPKLYEKLTAPDGRPSGEIKVAYGEVYGNEQHGPGGGHQYYLNPNTVREAIKAVVFKYNHDESFSVERGKGFKPIERTDMTPQEYKQLQRTRRYEAEERWNSINQQLKNERDANGVNVADQNNQFENKSNRGFVARPDSTYGYSKQTIQEATVIQDGADINTGITNTEPKTVVGKEIVRQNAAVQTVEARKPAAGRTQKR